MLGRVDGRHAHGVGMSPVHTGLFAATDDFHAYGHPDMVRANVIAVPPKGIISCAIVQRIANLGVFQAVISDSFSMFCEKRCQQEGLSASGFFRRNMNSRTLFARVICYKVLIISKISLVNIDKYINTYLLDSGK